MKKYDRELSEQRPQRRVQNKKIEIFKQGHIDMFKLTTYLKK